jgi:diguanylate cyclase (GGDEF)-like protein
MRDRKHNYHRDDMNAEAKNKTKRELLDEVAVLRRRVSELESLEYARAQSTQEGGREACFDFLTGLPNSSVFYNHLSQAIALAERNKQLVAVLFFGLDRFKIINDAVGPSAGDILLREVAERLRESLRKSDILARPGRDEFMILLTEVPKVGAVQHVVERIFTAFMAPFDLNGQDLIVTGSLGVSLFPADGTNAETLIKNSYTALNLARQENKNTVHFYSPAMNAGAFNRMLMENSLRMALKREEFSVHYQPQFDLANGRIIGLEALLRWQHPELGPISPDVFIPLMEEIGLMAPLTEWVLHTACSQNKAYQKAGFAPVRMAVNLSPNDLQKDYLLESVNRVLNDTKLEPEFLELEMTEGALIRDVEATAAILKKLEKMGVHLAIDDFGTGYSSLSYLRHFPISRLKIDRSFIEFITTDLNNATISRAIIALAHSLKISVMAEGVETVEQFEFLRSLKCNEGQGFLFCKPLTPADTMGALSSDFGALFCC